MANELQDLMDTLIMPMALPVLREACVMPALVATDFGAQAAEQYSTIQVNLPPDLGDAQDFDPAVGSSSTDLKPGKVDFVLDKWKYKQFKMNDREFRDVVTGGVLPAAASEAIKKLANAIDLDLLKLYKKIPGHAGTPGTTPSTKGDLVNVRRVLQEQLCPLGDRRLVLNTDAEAEYLELFSDVEKTGSTEALIQASLGVKFGFATFADQLMVNHTCGSLGATAGQVNGAVPAGASTMNIDGGSGAETLKEGDVFTVGGVVDSLGRPRQFVIRADATAASGAFTGVSFYPKAPAGGFADNAAITLVKPPSGSQYAINLAFHRDAFMFAARPLANEQSENSTISVATDPVTGIPLRLETWREPGKATRYWRFDILYGVQAIRPEYAARLHG